MSCLSKEACLYNQWKPIHLHPSSCMYASGTIMEDRWKQPDYKEVCCKTSLIEMTAKQEQNSDTVGGHADWGVGESLTKNYGQMRTAGQRTMRSLLIGCSVQSGHPWNYVFPNQTTADSAGWACTYMCVPVLIEWKESINLRVGAMGEDEVRVSRRAWGENGCNSISIKSTFFFL